MLPTLLSAENTKPLPSWNLLSSAALCCWLPECHTNFLTVFSDSSFAPSHLHTAGRIILHSIAVLFKAIQKLPASYRIQVNIFTIAYKALHYLAFFGPFPNSSPSLGFISITLFLMHSLVFLEQNRHAWALALICVLSFSWNSSTSLFVYSFNPLKYHIIIKAFSDQLIQDGISFPHTSYISSLSHSFLFFVCFCIWLIIYLFVSVPFTYCCLANHLKT